eukprot:580887_1
MASDRVVVNVCSSLSLVHVTLITAMSHKSHHSTRGSSTNTSFTAADSKRQLQSILGKSSKSKVKNERKQLLSEKENLKEKKSKLNAMKRNKNRSKSNASRPNKVSKKGKDDRIVKEQQKLSSEWMKISKEKDLLEKQTLTLKKEKLKLSKERNELEKQTKNITQLHQEWKEESVQMMKEIEDKYDVYLQGKTKERRVSLENHIEVLTQINTNIPLIHENKESMDELHTPITMTGTPIKLSGDLATERFKLQKLQKAAKDAQKRAEKTLSDLYRKKRELKKEQAQIDNERKKFKRLETEYNNFLKEKQRLKSQKKNLRKKEKHLDVQKAKKSRAQALEGAQIKHEKDRLAKTKNVLAHQRSLLTSEPRASAKNMGLLVSEQREYKRMKKKVTMYRDQIESLTNTNNILQRKLAKHNKFANDYAEDMELHDKLNDKTKYLVSTLRSKVIELQNQNKLLTKLLKRQKNITDAYHLVKDLKTARKLITKLVTENEDQQKKLSAQSDHIQSMKDLGEQYATQLYRIYDDYDEEDENDNEEEKEDFEFGKMSVEQVSELYQSMKQKISELMANKAQMEETLQERESQLNVYDSYANEWDIKQTLGKDRGQALYGRLKTEIDRLQNRLDQVYSELEKEKAAASTWQNTIENRLEQNDIDNIEDEKLILINQLKEENKKLQTLNTFNNKEDVKGHKAIAMDIAEQFGTGLFNNLQYILMDADLNNDDILKLKIKDKNDEIYKVVLIKQGDGNRGKEEVVKPIALQQKNMVKTLESIQGVIETYDNRISRMTDLLSHIKNSRKILKWNAIAPESKSHKPKFDLVISEIRQINVPSSPSRQQILNLSIHDTSYDRHQRTMRKFAKLNHRTESLESLDSVYDLSGDDNLTKFGIADARASTFRGKQYDIAPQKAVNYNDKAHQKLNEEDVGHIFDYYDKDRNGTISVKELIEVFKQLGVDISDKSKIQSIVSSLDVDNDGIVTRDNFIAWWFSASDSANMVQTQFDSGVRSLLYLYGMHFEGRKSDELHAFAQYLNAIFSENENRTKITHGLDRYLPIDVGDGGHDLLSKCVDGVLLAKMINFAVPNTIDERVLHLRDMKSDGIAPKQIVENLNIVLSSCKAVGVMTSSQISVERFLDPTYYEDAVRQILSELSLIHLSKAINLADNPVLIRLAKPYEEDQEIATLSSEVWLKRWINYQLKRSGEDIKIRKFGKAFRDGTVLCHVLDSVTKRKKRKHERFDINEALNQPTYARPGYILRQLKQQFGLKVFLTANDILIGNERLICLLCAQIFSKFKGMRKISNDEQKQVDDIFSEQRVPQAGQWDTHKGRMKNHKHKHKTKEQEATSALSITAQSDETERKERDVVNWMNDILCASNLSHLKLSNLTRDVHDGLVLLSFMDLIAPAVVDWEKVNKEKATLTRQQCLTNCHHIVSLIKNEPFCLSFFGIEDVASDAGNRIHSGNKDIILKICANLINYHYVTILSDLFGFKATEYDIIHWSNNELKKKLKYPRFCCFEERALREFEDSSLKSCLYYIDLLLMLSDDPRNDINRDIVIHKNNRQFVNDDYTKAECLSNARYALSIARKFGAVCYISPHDLVNVVPEITMAFVMGIVLLILTKNNNKEKQKHKIQITPNKEDDQNNSKTMEKAAQAEDMIENDLATKQRMASNHGRKHSVLQEYGIITNSEQLLELQTISRQYSTPITGPKRASLTPTHPK